MDIDNPDQDEPASHELAETLVSCSWFDPAFYAREAGVEGTPLELAAHYLTTGEAAMLRPSEAFDPRFYQTYHRDVAEHGMSPMRHFLSHGQHEKRYTSHNRLRADADLVAASGLFSARIFARSRRRAALPGLTDIEDYLVTRDHLAPIGEAFDSQFYAESYPDVRAGREMPLLHYLQVGKSEHRVANRRELERQRETLQARFDDAYYLRQLPHGLSVGEPLDHYILHGARQGLDPSPDFAADYYLRAYPDIANAALNPFLHFAGHGAEEGRLGRPDFAASLSAGEHAFDLARPTILVTTHEADRSGAPLVGLNVGVRLAASHNVIFHIGRSGPLLEAFREQCCLMAVGQQTPLEAEYFVRWLRETYRLGTVLLNSVETSPFAPGALYADVPAVALIHEFAEYTLPPGRMSKVVESVDRAIVPAGLIRDSLQAEFGRVRLGQATHVVVQPQGNLPQLPPDNTGADLTRGQLLATTGVDPASHDAPRPQPFATQPGATQPGATQPFATQPGATQPGATQPGATPVPAPPGPESPALPPKVRFVLGAGFVHMRKGVDLFVQTAAEVRRLHGPHVRFVWVGDGYDPTGDLHYCAWVADMVRRLDLEDTVYFLPAQGSLDALFALADVFYLPSRLDPFPNVVLDALKAGLGVVCFDRATGAAELFRDRHGAVGAAVTYCNTAEAAEALIRAFRPGQIKRSLGNAEFADRQFSFDAYMDALTAHLADAHDARARAIDIVGRIETSGRFDADFHDGVVGLPGSPHRGRAIRDYVARGTKGLMLYSPRPGFNEGMARLICGGSPALGMAEAPAQTHRCITFDEDRRRLPFDGRIAVHLHLHYPELAADMCAELVAAGGRADLIVTTTSESGRLEVAYALRGYKGGSVRIIVVANRGRDIGPFLTEVGPLLRDGGYDVVGHLHGKRSLAVDAALGDRWRSFLLGVLLGGTGGLARVLAPFTDDPTLGLLFPEDRHLVGWTKNRDIAAGLAGRMTPQPVLPEFPVFPLGTMFWARPAALAPLWSLDLTDADFPLEPIPYDGTILHAIERLLPAVCEAAGFTWSTLYRKGLSW